MRDFKKEGANEIVRALERRALERKTSGNIAAEEGGQKAKDGIRSLLNRSKPRQQRFPIPLRSLRYLLFNASSDPATSEKRAATQAGSLLCNPAPLRQSQAQ